MAHNVEFALPLTAVTQPLSSDGSIECPKCGTWMHDATDVSKHWRDGHFNVMPDDAPPDPLAPGNCFYGSVHGTYLKVITEPRRETESSIAMRQYLQLYPGSIDPISLRWLPDTAMPYSGGPSIYRPISRDAFLNQLLGVLESVDKRGVKS